jgi:predicted CXXCH cytochrome family protein
MAVLAASQLAAEHGVWVAENAPCIGCHRETATPDNHPVGIAPAGPVPVVLPLSADGKIMCTTCHFPHTDGSTRAGERISQGDDLCVACHDY